MINPEPKIRLAIVDALRGFALFGILQLHSLEHFDFYHFPDSIFKSIDPYIWQMVFFIFAGKSYAIFSMMFGLSFFIQMDSQAKKNVNFRWRFLWRLFIILIMGYFHGIIFCGDVLTVLASLGISLVLFYKLPTKLLLMMACLFLIDIPGLWHVYQSLAIVDFKLPESQMDLLYGESYNIFANGTFAEVCHFNAWKGQLAKWYFNYETGRCSQIPGLFILGLLIGRSRLFEQAGQKLRMIKNLLVCGLFLFAYLYTIKLTLPAMNLSQISFRLVDGLLASYSNNCFMVILVSGFILLYQSKKVHPILSLLAPYGRMSLTCYISMGLILIPVYYGYGLGMYQYFGATVCLFVGLLFFSLQLLFCHFWFRHFYYGPLEWIWRSLTFFSFNTPFRRNNIG